MLGFAFEFLIFGMWAVPYVLFSDKKIKSGHYLISFLYPALCDFFDS